MKLGNVEKLKNKELPNRVSWFRKCIKKFSNNKKVIRSSTFVNYKRTKRNKLNNYKGENNILQKEKRLIDQLTFPSYRSIKRGMKKCLIVFKSLKN